MQGFVFGKFLPFHKGHQALIAFAATQCDELTVLICCSDQEEIPSNIRLGWIVETFKDYPNIRPQVLEYKESELPNSSESSQDISRLWSLKFKEIVPRVELVVTSEPYGEFVAAYMHIKHIPFDPPREKIPVSGTLIRKNPFAYHDYLPDAVKPYYQKKLVLLGTESTGKSTLAAALAKYLGMPFVSEVGRELIPDANDFSEKDLYLVAERHAAAVKEKMLEIPPLLILDTDIHITQSYAHFSFGHYLDLPLVFYELQKADIYLYLTKDAPYIQDGTRLSKAQRDALDASHRATLAHFGVEYVEIGSSEWAERQVAAVEALQLVGIQNPLAYLNKR